MSNPYRKQKTITIDKKTGEPFNPRARVKGLNGKIRKSARRAFNDAGELNADSKQEANQIIAGLTEGFAKGAFSVEKKTIDSGILRQAFANPKGEGKYRKTKVVYSWQCSRSAGAAPPRIPSDRTISP